MTNSPDSQNYLVDGIPPVDVATPSTEEELCDIVASANNDGLGIIPWGGGTRVALGNTPERPCLVLDMTNLNRVVSHNYADLTASFQAGASSGFVSEVLAQQGQFLPIDPPIPSRATIGGTLAAAVSGPLKWHFGHPRDTVIGMKVVQPDGAITKSGGQVVKNVSGYDMSRLHIGGIGSLGIILEASFKLTPIPMYEKTLIASFGSVEEVVDASMRVFNSYVMPLAMIVFDPRVASHAGLDEGIARHHLAVRLGGRPRTLARQVDEISTILDAAGAFLQRDSEGPSPSVWRPLSDFGWSPEATPILNIRITALPSRICDILRMISRLRDSDLEPAALAEPGFGTVEASWFGPSDTPADPLITMVAKLRKQVSQLGGTAVIQRCPPDVKARVDVWGEDHLGIDVMRRMKRLYDPNGIMNPGRFVGRI
ncbi:MAG: FAD-binding oxidoreductase [Dehalococcoidia bacterium]|nr:FAD-binding oxidoreductase [Dehalococcoidia bacterium]